MFKVIVEEDSNKIGEFKAENIIIGTDTKYAVLGDDKAYGNRLSIVEKMLELIILDAFQTNLKDNERDKSFSDIRKKGYSKPDLERKEKAFMKGLSFVEENLERRLKLAFYDEETKREEKDFRVKIMNKDNVEVYSALTNECMLSTDSTTTVFSKKNEDEEMKNTCFKLLMSCIEYAAMSFVAIENNKSIKEISEEIDKANKDTYKKVTNAMDNIFYNVFENYKLFFYDKRLQNGEKYVVDDDYVNSYSANEGLKNMLGKLGFKFNSDEDEDDDDDDYDDPTESKFFS